MTFYLSGFLSHLESGVLVPGVIARDRESFSALATPSTNALALLGIKRFALNSDVQNLMNSLCPRAAA